MLERYEIGSALMSAAESEGAGYRAWTETLSSENVPRIEAFRGQQIDLGSGARISVLNPRAGMGVLDEDELNDASVVLRLEMGKVSFLLTGDIGSEGERRLISNGAEIDSTVLKVAHHGSRSSTSPEFLRRAQPIIDVISVGGSNRFGHPTDEVLERLADDLVLRTDKNGDITLSTDGNRLWLETQHRSD